MARVSLLVGLAILNLISVYAKNSDIPCQWKSKSGNHYNLQKLTIKSPEASYYIKDGDIPCTPEEEPAYSYAWNFCTAVTPASVPNACVKLNKAGVALQWLDLGTFSDCYVIGRYDPKQDDLSYSLLDSSDPTKGISMKYPAGDACSEHGIQRSATIDVMCDNVESVVVSAQEPSVCQYHLVMKSYYGCPQECPVTSAGLCSSHGLCRYDSVNRKSYCYCNEGYSGESCSSRSSAPQSYDGYSVQMGLLVTMVIVAIILVGVVGFLVYRITELRKEHSSDYSSLPGGGSEMVETVHF